MTVCSYTTSTMNHAPPQDADFPSSYLLRNPEKFRIPHSVADVPQRGHATDVAPAPTGGDRERVALGVSRSRPEVGPAYAAGARQPNRTVRPTHRVGLRTGCPVPFLEVLRPRKI